MTRLASNRARATARHPEHRHPCTPDAVRVPSCMRPPRLNTSAPFGLYDLTLEHSHCGAGFLTRKDSVQTHDVLLKGHEALCAVPHRGGISSEGVRDGAGISEDLSLRLFSRLTGRKLETGAIGVGNFFLPADQSRAATLIEDALRDEGLRVVTVRDLPVDNTAIPPRAVRCQLPIRQWVFAAPDGVRGAGLDARIHRALLAIKAVAYTDSALEGLYPLSLSARTQVFKGRLNS